VNKIKQMKDPLLQNYAVTASDRQYNVWQRDPLAVQLTSRAMASQKLEYMHLNPIQPYWLLCNSPTECRFSSAMYYEQNMDDFGLLTHLQEVF